MLHGISTMARRAVRNVYVTVRRVARDGAFVREHASLDPRRHRRLLPLPRQRAVREVGQSIPERLEVVGRRRRHPFLRGERREQRRAAAVANVRRVARRSVALRRHAVVGQVSAPRPVAEENVGRFDVVVHDPRLRQAPERAQNVAAHAQHRVRREAGRARAIAHDGVADRFHPVALHVDAQLLHDEHLRRLAKDLLRARPEQLRHAVRAVESAQHPRFLGDAVARGAGRESRHDFDGHVVSVIVFSSVHRAESTPAERRRYALVRLESSRVSAAAHGLERRAVCIDDGERRGRELVGIEHVARVALDERRLQRLREAIDARVVRGDDAARVAADLEGLPDPARHVRRHARVDAPHAPGARVVDFALRGVAHDEPCDVEGFQRLR
mmetsp:Transcript_2672/g.8019  ORF Transcript_2672/g.8019 Transcript_2672/m.8019 type:complete len:385 (-) Transcript_2672:428-1582(-)